MREKVFRKSDKNLKRFTKNVERNLLTRAIVGSGTESVSFRSVSNLRGEMVRMADTIKAFLQIIDLPFARFGLARLGSKTQEEAISFQKTR